MQPPNQPDDRPGGTLDVVLVHCTGTLIGPRAVLTVGHCVDSVDVEYLYFVLGHTLNSGGATILNGPTVEEVGTFLSVESVHPHPDLGEAPDFSVFDRARHETFAEHDIAVLLLAEDAPSDVQPLPANESPLVGEEWVGEDITVVGFGYDCSGVNGNKRSAQFDVERIEDRMFVSGLDSFYENRWNQIVGADHIRSGDSGGPALGTVEGRLTVLGVLSSGTLHGLTMHSRADAHASFIREAMGAAPAHQGDPEAVDRPEESPDPASFGEEECPDDYLDNGECDEGCLEPRDPDCVEQAVHDEDESCPEWWRGDGECDPECQNPPDPDCDEHDV